MRVFITAEIGINHNGDLDIAKKMIDATILAGCDAVKFQKRTPELCVPEKQRDVMRETPWGLMTYSEYRYRVEFGEKEYDEIDRYCKEKGIEWYASAWDVESQLFLRKYNLSHNKIASAMLTNIKLLEMVAEEKKHTFISTGMSTMAEIEKAVELFRKYDCPFELMHCNSSYPMNSGEANLCCIITLRQKFGCNVGYSGHEKGLQISIAAVALGATSLERHITLDRTAYGSDQAASLEPQGLIRLVRDVRIIGQAMGDGVKRVYESEKPNLKKLRYTN
ncbi:N-acetylneuraminate synthase family protein [Chloroflexota bacterium]